MFTITEDVLAGKYKFSCQNCGKENIHYIGNIAHSHCMGCLKIITPSAEGLIRSELCRIAYYKNWKVVSNEEEKGERTVHTCSYSPY